MKRGCLYFKQPLIFFIIRENLSSAVVAFLVLERNLGTELFEDPLKEDGIEHSDDRDSEEDQKAHGE